MAVQRLGMTGNAPSSLICGTAVTNSQPAPALPQSAATGSPLQKDGAMAGIARNVELYILAYKLAWKYISEHHKHEQPDIARHLHDYIRSYRPCFHCLRGA